METITSFEDARREIARIDHDAKLVPPNEITPLVTTFIPRMLAVLDFLIVQAADFKPQCSKCGSALERHSEGYLGCRQCAINEIDSQYSHKAHDDALSKLVKDMDREDATLKRYDASEVLAQTMSAEDSQAKVAMQDFKHPGEDEQNALAMHGPKDVLVEHAHEAEARLAMHKRVGIKFEAANSGKDVLAIIEATSLTDADHVTYVTGTVPEPYIALFGIYQKDALVMPLAEALRLCSALTKNPRGASYRTVLVAPIESADDAAGPCGCPVGEPGVKGPPGVGPASVLVSFTLNTKPFAVAQPKMTGKEIKALLPEDKRNHAIYVEMAGMSADMKVGDDEAIDVANREIYSVPPAVFGSGQEEAKQQVDKFLGQPVDIIVNTETVTLYPRDGKIDDLTYEQIIRMACDQIDKSKGRLVKPPDYKFPDMSVTYRHKVPFDQLPGERDGMMCRGQKVVVTPGMIINAYCT